MWADHTPGLSSSAIMAVVTSAENKLGQRLMLMVRVLQRSRSPRILAVRSIKDRVAGPRKSRRVANWQSTPSQYRFNTRAR